jgi:hypothetical protein
MKIFYCHFDNYQYSLVLILSVVMQQLFDQFYSKMVLKFAGDHYMQELKKFFVSEEYIQDPKVILIGEAVGKNEYRKKLLPQYYTENLEQYIVPVKIQEKQFNVKLYYEDFVASNEALRDAIFVNMAVFILVYSFLDHHAVDNLMQKYFPAIAKFNKPIILIGTDKERITSIDVATSTTQIIRIAAECNAAFYCELSAGENTYPIYEKACSLALGKKHNANKSNTIASCIKLNQQLMSPRQPNSSVFFTASQPQDNCQLSVSPPRNIKHIASGRENNAEAVLLEALTSPRAEISERINIRQNEDDSGSSSLPSSFSSRSAKK